MGQFLQGAGLTLEAGQGLSIVHQIHVQDLHRQGYIALQVPNFVDRAHPPGGHEGLYFEPILQGAAD